MKTNNNNKTSSQVKKLHNPKAHMPAAYIPSWLIQIQDSKLSLGAKMVYGRLAQWSNAKGIVYRTSNQLCQELGMTKSPVERYLRELRTVGLIGTYQVEQGGINYFEFYDHEWMHDPINKNLCFGESGSTPPPKEVVPPTDTEVPPPPKEVVHKYKEIKEKKEKDIYTLFDLLACNPNHIPEQMLQDWLTVRKSKKAKVTKTAWEKINKTLIKIEKEVQIKPIDAFETMVANSWQSLDVKYFKDKPNGYGNQNIDFAHK